MRWTTKRFEKKRKRKIFLIQRAKNQLNRSNIRGATLDWNFSQNHGFWAKSESSSWFSVSLFSPFSKVQSPRSNFEGFGDSRTMLYIFEKRRSSSLQWCNFHDPICYYFLSQVLQKTSSQIPIHRFESKELNDLHNNYYIMQLFSYTLWHSFFVIALFDSRP